MLPKPSAVFVGGSGIHPEMVARSWLRTWNLTLLGPKLVFRPFQGHDAAVGIGAATLFLVVSFGIVWRYTC